MTDRAQKPVVFTNKARCRDCYRCLRACPVKAIRMENSQAFVEDERCIACGTCIRECPQKAKNYRNDLAHARRLLQVNDRVAVSLAPAFAAAFPQWQQARIASGLRALGFSFVGETATGAFHVAQQLAQLHKENPEQPHVGTACPAAVRYIESYWPELESRLTPLVSPMIAHAKLLKQNLPTPYKVVFIGPCVAKKMEAERAEHASIVDCTLTFEELHAWFEEEKIDLSILEESGFDEMPGGDARYYPLVGGSLRTAGLTTDVLDTQVMTVSGCDALDQALRDLKERPCPVVLEPLFCSQGCINGPACAAKANLFERRRNIIDYARKGREKSFKPPVKPPEPVSADLLTWELPHDHKTFAEQSVSEDDIRQILEKTGKARKEDQLNCGACGYASCRDKAIAVLRGMAEAEMCIPHMRRLAEQRTDRIIETSPNGIVICDQRLRIIHMNPTFGKFFRCNDALLGRSIGTLMDAAPFEQVAESDSETVLETTVRHNNYGLTCYQILYRLPEENQIVGIFVNVTRSRADREELERLRGQTVMQAQELLEHQMDMAQKLAEFVGQSTAQGEKLVDNLMHLAGSDTVDDQDNGLTWHISTQK